MIETAGHCPDGVRLLRTGSRLEPAPGLGAGGGAESPVEPSLEARPAARSAFLEPLFGKAGPLPGGLGCCWGWPGSAGLDASGLAGAVPSGWCWTCHPFADACAWQVWRGLGT